MRRGSKWWTALALAGLAAAGGLAAWPELKRLLCVPPVGSLRETSRVFGTAAEANPELLEAQFEGCRETPGGVAVDPGSTCRVRFVFHRRAGEVSRLRLSALLADGIENRLSLVGADGAERHVFYQNAYQTDEIDISSHLDPSATEGIVILQATNRSSVPAVVLRNAFYKTMPDGEPCLVRWPLVYGVFGVLVLAVLALRRLARATPGVSLAVFLAGVGGIAVAKIAGTVSQMIVGGLVLACVVAAALVAWPERQAGRSVTALAALWAIGLLFVGLRYDLLVAVVNAPLDPDAVNYRIYAERMSLFSPTGFFSGTFSEREPMFVLAAHLFFKLFGASDLHLRYVSFLCAVPIPFLTLALGRELGLRRAWALSAAVAVSICPYLLNIPRRGLRDDLFMSGLLIFLIVLLRALKKNSRWRWVPVAAAGAISMLTRTVTLPFAVLLFGWLWLEGCLGRRKTPAGVARPWRLWEAGLCVAVIFLSFLPIRMSWKRIYGYADWAERGYARWNANLEFPERLGTPGFPTKAEFQVHSYAGPPMTYRQYLLELHTPRELLARTVRGYRKMILALAPRSGRLPAWANSIMRGFFLLGAVLSLFKRPGRFATLAALASLSYTAFLYDLGLVEPYRHIAHAFPLLAIGALLVAQWFSEILTREGRFALDGTLTDGGARRP